MIHDPVGLLAHHAAVAFMARLRATRPRRLASFLAICRRRLGGCARRLGWTLKPQHQLDELFLAQALKIDSPHPPLESAIPSARKGVGNHGARPVPTRLHQAKPSESPCQPYAKKRYSAHSPCPQRGYRCLAGPAPSHAVFRSQSKAQGRPESRTDRTIAPFGDSNGAVRPAENTSTFRCYDADLDQSARRSREYLRSGAAKHGSNTARAISR